MMSPDPRHGKPRRLSLVLESGAASRELLHAVRQILAAEEVLNARIDQPIRAHCRVARIDPDTLVLETDSSVWAHRMRFLLPDLQRYFGRPIKLELVFREPARPPPRIARPRALSSSAAAGLRAFAASLEPGPLREVMGSLASRASARQILPTPQKAAPSAAGCMKMMGASPGAS